MSKAVPSERKKWEMNSVPRSEVMWLGTPCFEKTCRMNNCAGCCDVIVSYVGRVGRGSQVDRGSKVVLYDYLSTLHELYSCRLELRYPSNLLHIPLFFK